MKTKRMSVIGLVMLCATALFVGCSGITDGTVSGGIPVATVADVTLNVTNIPTDYQAMVLSGKSAYGARTILPGSPYNLKSTGLVWMLSGSTTSGLSYPASKIQVVVPPNGDGSSGTANLASLGAYVWELTLTAYLEDADNAGEADTTQPVLVGYTSVDLRSGTSTSVTFSMIKSGLETPGTVSITGYYVDGTLAANSTLVTNSNAVAKYTMGLYDRITGELVTGTDTSGSLETTVTSPTAASSPANHWGITYGTTASNKAYPGTYLFAITFYNANDVAIGYYSDLLIVDPGNATTKDIGVIDVINKVPAAPSNFKAFLVKDTEDSDIEGFYAVRFEWEDNSNNETNFEIELLEAGGAKPLGLPTTASDKSVGPTTDTSVTVTKNTTGTAVGTWTVSPNPANADVANDTIRLYGLSATNPLVTESGKEFPGATDIYGSSLYKAGSLRAGSKTLTMYLKLGKVYEARIRALNATGTSLWVERTSVAATTASENNAETAGYPYATGGTAYTDATYHINRLRIKYNLNGSAVKLHKTDSDVYTARYTAYETYTGVADSSGLLEIHTDTTPAYIEGGIGTFKYWALESDSTVQVEEFTHENLAVLAIYEFTGNITVAGYEDLAKADVELGVYKTDKTTALENSVTYSNTFDETTATGYDAKKYAVIKGFYTENDIPVAGVLKVTVANTGNKYDYFKLSIANSVASDTAYVYEGDDNEFYQNLGSYDGGTYILKVLARDANTQTWYSATYIATINK